MYLPPKLTRTTRSAKTASQMRFRISGGSRSSGEVAALRTVLSKESFSYVYIHTTHTGSGRPTLPSGLEETGSGSGVQKDALRCVS